MNIYTPDSWIERQPEDEHRSYPCSGCGHYGRCVCDEYDELSISEDEQSFDDTVRCCPECETPNQFGELCNRCREDIERERI